MSHNLDATVFVYRHADGHITALYKEDARAMEGKEDFEHIATLEPRMWIEYHYDDAKKMREKCAKVCEEVEAAYYRGSESSDAIRAMED